MVTYFRNGLQRHKGALKHRSELRRLGKLNSKRALITEGERPRTALWDHALDSY